MTQKISNPLSLCKFLKFFILLISSAAVLIFLSLSCSKNPADLDDENGELSAEDSAAIADGFIPIYSFHDLCKIGKDHDLPLHGRYILIHDIDVPKNSWRTFEPIGNGSRVFNGEFDGRGRTIKKVYIRSPDSSAVGLFGFIDGAKIHRLHIEADSIIGGIHTGGEEINVGGIAGMARNSVIDRCSFKGTVRGRHWVGGIAGTAFASHITRCISKGTVLSDTDALGSVGGAAGGLIGSLTDSSKTALSYSSANVRGGHNTGGLVGHNEKSAITQSYSTGSVSGGKSYAGGLVGNIYDGTVAECYSTGKVSYIPPPGEAGGLVGRVSSRTKIAGSYWDTSSSQMAASAGTAVKDTTIIDIDGEPKDTTVIIGEQGRNSSLMTQKKTYVGWDFDKVWNIDEGNSTPYFR